jgi:hypothetical protein
MPWDLHHHCNYKATAWLPYGPSTWKNIKNLSWAMKETADMAYGVMGKLLEQFDNGVFLKNWCGINVWDRPRGHCKEFHEVWIRVSLVKGCIPMRLDVHGCLRCLSCQSQGNARCHPY